MISAQTYSALKTNVDGIEVIRLTDATNHIEVSIAPSIGNLAYEMKVNGKNAFWMPASSPAELKRKPQMGGNPFLAPWANRIDQWAFWVNGKKYSLNRDLGNIRPDQNQNPIHGLLLFSPYWQVRELVADERSAHVTSRLEFWRYPELMAQFPFAHTLEMTYRLSSGALEVETRIENHAVEPMPVAIGYHPYFRLDATPRSQWKVHLAARDQMTLSPKLIPTGETKPNPFADPQPLEGISLDDVFTTLVRDAAGRAEFWVQGNEEKLSVIYGPKYKVAVVYSPVRASFICFEPMVAPTNAFNLAHDGIYKDLQSIPPNGEWKESFWIRPSGF